jgi:two-component system chemotaxis response regulator CheY
MIVDDHGVTQRVLAHILQRGGYDIAFAANGLEALHVLETTSVDLILLDIDMPDMDGMTLLKHLRGQSQYVTLPIVMLTASGQDDDRHVAEAYGANGFLTKPASSTELLEMIERFISLR